MLSTKTSKVLAVFMAVSTTVAFASWMAQDVDIPAEQETGPQTLLDDEGREYTLTQNADGTETATYEDGRSVTVKREENGSLRYISGAEGLIAGLAAGYYMFHGLSGGTGGRYSVVQGRYIPNGPVQPLKEKDDYRSSGGSSSSSSSRRITVNKGSSSSKSSSSAKSSSHSSSKSGFGSAGARSSAS
ncbi:hypothetical protein [Selenomonas ruminantium]|uniref:Uncharacterized protein n=1 Tax=Selenomonas ruminantium TaxID=971 RepID=A0A1K1QKL0_SELRU|nr:hypothetical protein [Selenomonas ruminantium]SEA14258.1 hypothetical protein SAMN05660648_02094 [Selenomonas ruminantium]SFW60480.1 hypothetical protein SAMN02910323_2707 [Selenomonas ruminantium]